MLIKHITNNIINLLSFHCLGPHKKIRIYKYKDILCETKGLLINPLASPSEGAPALKYGDVNTLTPSPGEVKGLISYPK